MNNPFVRKLAAISEMSATDRSRLMDALGPVRRVTPRVDVVDECQDPYAVKVILDGWACLYQQFEDGRRQIISLLVPGDHCHSQIFRLDRKDRAIAALTPVALATISGRTMRDLTARSPALEIAFQREAMIALSIYQERMVSLGQRTAIERLAHLLCELEARLSSVGLTYENSYLLPVTQVDLGDMLGLTHVHINRMLRELQRKGLIAFRNRQLNILDSARLGKLAIFDSTYLSNLE